MKRDKAGNPIPIIVNRKAKHQFWADSFRNEKRRQRWLIWGMVIAMVALIAIASIFIQAWKP